MDRQLWLKQWDEAMGEGLWAASWKKSVDGLSPSQAATKPAAARHSIWQLANHVIFWREHDIHFATTGKKPSKDEVARLNFLEPPDISDAAWKATIERLAATHAKIRELVADPKTGFDRLQYLLPHDCYHFGQINYVRAILGLPPIE